MFKKPKNKLIFASFVLLAAGLACGLTDDLGAALAALCEQDTYVVTKTEDSYDALCTTDDCSLRDAIATANSCAGPHTIELPAGTYIIAITGRDEDGNTQGDYDITDDLTINGTGNPIVGGSGHDRVFEIFSPAAVEINGIYITGGNAQLGAGLRNHGDTTLNDVQIYDNSATVPSGGSGGSAGGGIHNDTNTLTLNNVQIFHNIADYGGGIHNFATATLNTFSLLIYENNANQDGGALWNNFASASTHQELTMRDNTAHNNGGGIYNGGGEVTITNTSVIHGNHAFVDGGGFFNADIGTLTTDQTLFSENMAERGGGLFNGGTGVVDLLSTDFSENRAATSGGAIFNEATADLRAPQIGGNQSPLGAGVYNFSTGELTMAAAMFNFNTASTRGGGLLNQGVAEIHHSLFLNNAAAQTGGAIENGGTLDLSNVTLSHNITEDLSGPALLNGGTASLNFVTVTDNIGASPGGAVFTGPATIEINNSLIANNSGGDCSLPASMTFSTENLDSDGTCAGFTITADPLLAPLGDNGGTTLTHALSPDSPAIDAVVSGCVFDDQRGVTRPRGTACDLGAFELNETTSTDVCTTAFLITEINNANSTPSTTDTINLDPGCIYELATVDNVTDGNNGTPSIVSPIIINGNGATIRRSLAFSTPEFRIFHMSAGSYLELINLTISNGRADGSNGGGAVYANSSLHINDSTFSDNYAHEGGAIYHKSTGSLGIRNSAFNNNQAAEWGGAIYNGDPSSTIASTVIRNSSFTGNQATNGGAVANLVSGDMVLRDSTLQGNMTTQNGGAVANLDHMLVESSTISSNVADRRGGGISNGGTLTVVNSTLSGNSTPFLTGGAIESITGSLTIDYTTIAFNSTGGSPGGALYEERGTLTINNSIVSNNTGGDCDIPSSGASLGGVNIDSDGSCSGFVLTTDPLLGPLAGNGGPTKTHALNPGSPALDTAAGDCPSNDQRGEVRPSGAACDIGSYELSVPGDPVTVPPPVPGDGTTFVISGETLCWTGPGSLYPVVSTVKQGTEVELLGSGAQAGWWVIDNPRYSGVACWLPEDKLDVDPNLDLSTLKVFPVPPLPTATVTPAPAKPQAPTSLQAATTTCSQQNHINTLTWKDNATNETGYRVYRSGQLITTLGPNATEYKDSPGGSGPYEYYVEAFNNAGSAKSNTDKDDGCIF